MVSGPAVDSYYAYKPNHIAPICIAAIVGISLALHIWQNFRYRYWRVTFFMFWGGAVFSTGWVMRAISSYHVANQNLYIAQYVLILAGPPIYSSAEYNILGRLMHYLPMHAPLNPSRVMYFFIYLGILVETLTAAGGARMAAAGGDLEKIKTGATLVAVAAVLQIVVESMFIFMVVLLHRRCSRAKMLTSKVRTLCIMLYGTSALVILRGIYRIIEKFSIASALDTSTCEGICHGVLRNEWLLFVFDATPMILYTYWLNLVHPGRYLPHSTETYLDFNKTERVGPGWQDQRSTWQTFADPFDLSGVMKGQPNHVKFWLQDENWPAVSDKTTRARNGYVSVAQDKNVVDPEQR